MEAASNVLWTVNALADGCVAALALCLRLNELVGAVLLGAVLAAWRLLAQIWTSLGLFLYYASSDLVCFLEDVAALLRAVIGAVDSAAQGIGEGAVLAYLSLVRAGLLVGDVVTGTCSLVVAGACHAWSSATSLLSLLLGSALLLLRLVPLALSQAALCAGRALSAVAGTAAGLLVGAAATSWGAAARAASACRTFFWKQPRDAYSGLAIVCVLAAAVRLAVRLRLHRRLGRRAAALFRARPAGSPDRSPPPFTMTLRPSQRRDRLRCLERELEQEREKQLCVVCQDQERCVILLPCGHFALCVACMQTLVEVRPACPVCRHLIDRVVRVYA